MISDEIINIVKTSKFAQNQCFIKKFEKKGNQEFFVTEGEFDNIKKNYHKFSTWGFKLSFKEEFNQVTIISKPAIFG